MMKHMQKKQNDDDNEKKTKRKTQKNRSRHTKDAQPQRPKTTIYIGYPALNSTDARGSELCAW